MSNAISILIADTPLPGVTRLAIARKPDGETTRETWTIDGSVCADSPSALADTLAELESRLASLPAAITLSLGEQSMRVLESDGALAGPALDSFELTPAASEGFKPKQPYRAILSASYASDTEADAWLESLSAEHRTSASELASIYFDGRARMRPGTDENTAIATLSPALADGYRRIEERFSFASDGAVRFAIADQLALLALPQGVSDGHYVRTTALDPDGRETETIAGYFIGAEASARASALRPPRNRLLEEELNDDPFRARVDFRFTALRRPSVAKPTGSAGGGAGSLIEHVTYSERRRIVEHPLLGRSAVYRQAIGAPEFRVIQEGKASAAESAVPPEPPLYPTDLIEREVRYQSQKGARAGLIETRWRYVFAPTRDASPQVRH